MPGERRRILPPHWESSECRQQDRSFVFRLFDIFKHLRGSGTVDKIKKYRRDLPRAVALTSILVFTKSVNVESLPEVAMQVILGNVWSGKQLFYDSFIMGAHLCPFLK